MKEIVLSGRKDELKRLQRTLATKESELVAVTGRRRVGKTFLIKRAYDANITFYLTGQKDASQRSQLENFSLQLNHYSKNKFKATPPGSWKEAFIILREYIARKKSIKKQVIFFDELPWLASSKSGFVQALDYFWNSWAVSQNLVVVISGSTASWMIQNIINDKGGLHNRVTTYLNLQPFTLPEVRQYFIERKINMPVYDIVMIYMALGGIPYYLREVEKGDTAMQAIGKICFGKAAPLYREFSNLYKALFTRAENHILVVKSLATKRKGLSRNEIIRITRLKNGGGLTKLLRELEESSFITSYKPFGKLERNSLYRLSDEYTMFYFSFLEKENYANKNQWMKIAQSPSFKSWCGFSFESFCMKHVDNIKEALGISGIFSEQSSFVKLKDADLPGTQIDLLIDRSDNAINICEIKYYSTEFQFTALEAKNLRIKKEILRKSTGTKKQLISTLITTFGLINESKVPDVDKRLTLYDIFGK